MRQLVTIREVSNLLPIEGADLIELAIVDGWQCVVKKGEFQVGDKGLYFEIDSMLPATDPRFAFLAKGKVQDFARVKTVRLKGQLSQGLLMPMSIITPEEQARIDQDHDLMHVFRIQKYEQPLPTGGQQKGTFPSNLVPKTDQERIQNMPRVLEGTKISDFEITEKLDGTSCTIWSYVPLAAVVDPDHSPIGVASRNWEMKLDDGNVYAKVVHDNDLVNKLNALGRNIAIQGEIIGPAIQGNKYKLVKQTFYVFDIYDIDAKRYLGSEERLVLANKLGLNHVPLLVWNENTPMTLDSVLGLADGVSALNGDIMREGLVFKALDGSMSFKAISNKWLLKYE